MQALVNDDTERGGAGRKQSIDDVLPALGTVRPTRCDYGTEISDNCCCTDDSNPPEPSYNNLFRIGGINYMRFMVGDEMAVAPLLNLGHLKGIPGAKVSPIPPDDIGKIAEYAAKNLKTVGEPKPVEDDGIVLYISWKKVGQNPLEPKKWYVQSALKGLKNLFSYR